eukprot:GILI01003104.1.p1 GENE.GILI01003104.1~~GILI01003104.1.p1  ORF type:complete len:1029 (+),score=222.24 GILI01003104.1:167-3253(+)
MATMSLPPAGITATASPATLKITSVAVDYPLVYVGMSNGNIFVLTETLKAAAEVRDFTLDVSLAHRQQYYGTNGSERTGTVASSGGSFFSSFASGGNASINNTIRANTNNNNLLLISAASPLRAAPNGADVSSMGRGHSYYPPQQQAAFASSTTRSGQRGNTNGAWNGSNAPVVVLAIGNVIETTGAGRAVTNPPGTTTTGAANTSNIADESPSATTAALKIGSSAVCELNLVDVLYGHTSAVTHLTVSGEWGMLVSISSGSEAGTSAAEAPCIRNIAVGGLASNSAISNTPTPIYNTIEMNQMQRNSNAAAIVSSFASAILPTPVSNSVNATVPNFETAPAATLLSRFTSPTSPNPTSASIGTDGNALMIQKAEAIAATSSLLANATCADVAGDNVAVAVWDTRRRVLIRNLNLQQSTALAQPSRYVPTSASINIKNGDIVLFGHSYTTTNAFGPGRQAPPASTPLLPYAHRLIDAIANGLSYAFEQRLMLFTANGAWVASAEISADGGVRNAAKPIKDTASRALATTDPSTNNFASVLRPLTILQRGTTSKGLAANNSSASRVAQLHVRSSHSSLGSSSASIAILTAPASLLGLPQRHWLSRSSALGGVSVSGSAASALHNTTATRNQLLLIPSGPTQGLIAANSKAAAWTTPSASPLGVPNDNKVIQSPSKTAALCALAAAASPSCGAALAAQSVKVAGLSVLIEPMPSPDLAMVAATVAALSTDALGDRSATSAGAAQAASSVNFAGGTSASSITSTFFSLLAAAPSKMSTSVASGAPAPATTTATSSSSAAQPPAEAASSGETLHLNPTEASILSGIVVPARQGLSSNGLLAASSAETASYISPFNPSANAIAANGPAASLLPLCLPARSLTHIPSANNRTRLQALGPLIVVVPDQSRSVLILDANTLECVKVLNHDLVMYGGLGSGQAPLLDAPVAVDTLSMAAPAPTNAAFPQYQQSNSTLAAGAQLNSISSAFGGATASYAATLAASGGEITSFAVNPSASLLSTIDAAGTVATWRVGAA